MCRVLPLRLALLLLALLAAANSAFAETKVVKVDESLFALYALDDMYARLPKPNPSMLDRQLFELTVLIAERRLLFDRLRRHVEKQKKMDSTVLGLYRTYEVELNLWKDLKEKLTAARETYARTLRINQMNANYRVNTTFMSAFAQMIAGGGTIPEAGAVGFLVAGKTAIKEGVKLSREQLEALKQLSRDADKAVTESSIIITRNKHFRAFLKTRGELRTENDWTNAEFFFERGFPRQ